MKEGRQIHRSKPVHEYAGYLQAMLSERDRKQSSSRNLEIQCTRSFFFLEQASESNGSLPSDNMAGLLNYDTGEEQRLGVAAEC